MRVHYIAVVPVICNCNIFLSLEIRCLKLNVAGNYNWYSEVN